MRSVILIILLVSASIFSSLAASLASKWPAIEQTIENCRILQNGLIVLGATEVALSAVTPINYSLTAVITGMHMAKFPALAVAAAREQDFSLLGEVSDSVALFGLSGFWAELFDQNEDNQNVSYVCSILLSNVVVTLIFNILNRAIKQHCPLARDEIKRRIMRALFVAAGNILIPLLLRLAAHSDNIGRLEDMITLLFLTNTLGHVIAEVAGYVVANYLLGGLAVERKEGVS